MEQNDGGFGYNPVERIDVRQRREELKRLIRELGLWALPPQKDIARKYGVSDSMIQKDIKAIVKSINPKEIDEVGFEFFSANSKAWCELRKMLFSGTND